MEDRDRNVIVFTFGSLISIPVAFLLSNIIMPPPSTHPVPTPFLSPYADVRYLRQLQFDLSAQRMISDRRASSDIPDDMKKETETMLNHAIHALNDKLPPKAIMGDMVVVQIRLPTLSTAVASHVANDLETLLRTRDFYDIDVVVYPPGRGWEGIGAGRVIVKDAHVLSISFSF